MRYVYLDHAATTPIDARVLQVVMPYLTENYGNASSVHSPGRKARFAIEESRERIAALLGSAPGEIVFTSGGTEADNLAIKSVINAPGHHFITAASEHEAVLRPAERLKKLGSNVTVLAPERTGAVTQQQLSQAMSEDTRLISLMHANNELGTILPIRDLAAFAHRHGAYFHTDAVQTSGLLRVRVDDLGVDMLSLSAHKFYGPKGVGVLYVRGGVELEPLIEGGAQERRRRGGTENVAAVVGMAEALDLAVREAEDRLARVTALRDRLYTSLRQALGDDFVLNTPVEEGRSVPHILNIAFPPKDGRPLDGEMLLLNLDLEGVYVSAGSACTSGALEPSHVLQAIGLDRETASAAIRFSLGKENSEEDIDYAVDRLSAVIRRMRN